MLRAGASCSARIRASIRQDVLLVPLSGFVTEENASFAFVLGPTGKTNRAGVEVFELSRRAIRTGASDVTDVEVVEDLSDTGDGRVESSYALLRIVTWAFPILGVLGTVIGVTEALVLLTNLVEKSLVLLDAASGRYRLLDTVRQYAEERLAASGEAEHTVAGRFQPGS